MTLQKEFGPERIEAYLCDLPKNYIDPVRPEHVKPFSLEKRYEGN